MKRVLHWVGGALAIAGAVFVFFRLRQQAAEIDFTRLSSVHLVLLALLAVVYGAANTFLALAWRNLLAFCGPRASRSWAIYAYGVSQLAKYIPGNIFHVAGRQAIGMAAGYGGGALVRSTLWELGLISATGAIFGLLTVNLIVSQVPAPATVATFAFVLAAVTGIVWRYVSHELAVAMGEQALFLTISGAVFVGCLVIAAPAAALPPSFIPAAIGAFVVAWLAGLVTPGAPAGLGVREVVLLFLLAGINREPEVLLAILLGRIVNVAGDVLFFALGALLGHMKA